MIELKHVSARTIVPYSEQKINELVENAGAESVEDVLELMTLYPQYNWREVKFLFQQYVEKRLNLANKRGYEPQIFNTKGYSNETLLHQDLLNKGNVLLLHNPTTHTVKYSSLKSRTIKAIKSDLSHTFSDGSNHLIENGAYRNIGIDSVSHIISSIEMYEEQIERQSKLTKETDINLFELHKKEKSEIVEEMYNEIIMYLLYHTEEMLVWGNLTETAKKIYLSTAINKKAEALERRTKIKEHIVNYTTLPELKKVGRNNFKVLKRFIVK